MTTWLPGALLSAAVTLLALPRTAPADSYWTIVGLGLLPYAVFGFVALWMPRPWMRVPALAYGVVDVVARGVCLLGPDAVRNPSVVVAMPLLGAPLVVLVVAGAMRWWRSSSVATRRRPSSS